MEELTPEEHSWKDLANKYFDAYGDLLPWVAEKLKEGPLTHEDAAAYLADAFAGETHGNYTGRTLFLRAEVQKYLSVKISSRTR